MQDIYLVVHGEMYEGHEVLCAFTSRQKAIEAAERFVAWSNCVPTGYDDSDAYYQQVSETCWESGCDYVAIHVRPLVE